MFTGREYVSKFGIYEYRNRAYHPGLGRFMSEDPKLFEAGDNNFFRYCGNDPVDRTDPMGLSDAILKAQYDPNYIGGAGSGQFDKMQSMGAAQVGARLQAHTVEMKQTEAWGAAHSESQNQSMGGMDVSYKESEKWGNGGAGEVGARDDYAKVKLSGFKTGYGGYIAQRDRAKNGGYIAVPGRPEILKYNKATKQKMQTLDLRPNDIPPAYHAIGVHYAHGRHDDYIPQQIDQESLRSAGAKAVLATPPYKGSNPEAAPRLHYFPESD
jgi:RHS repeat-associated protein